MIIIIKSKFKIRALFWRRVNRATFSSWRRVEGLPYVRTKGGGGEGCEKNYCIVTKAGNIKEGDADGERGNKRDAEGGEQE